MISIFGDNCPPQDGTCIRDYIHVEDLIDAHIRALGALDKGNCVFNLGNEPGFSVRQVIDAAERVTRQRIPVEVSPRHPGDPAVLVAGSDRIKGELG